MERDGAVIIFITINVVLYILVHGMKFRRYASTKNIRAIKEIYAEVFFLALLPEWVIATGDIAMIALGGVLGIRIIWLVYKNKKALVNLAGDVFQSTFSLAETIVLSVCVLGTLAFVSRSIVAWFVPFLILLVACAKEAILAGKKRDEIKDATDNNNGTAGLNNALKTDAQRRAS